PLQVATTAATATAISTDEPATPAAVPILTKMPVPTIEPRPRSTAPGTPSTRASEPSAGDAAADPSGGESLDDGVASGRRESLDDIERLVDVLAEANGRFEAMPNHAALVEHERDPAGEAERGLDAPRLRELAAWVGEQREGQPVVLLEA